MNTVHLLAHRDDVIVSQTLPKDWETGSVATISVPGAGKATVMQWGKNNDLPQRREMLLSDNNIVPALLKTKRNIIAGSGLYAYRIRYEQNATGGMKKVVEEVDMPQQAVDFFEVVSFDEYMNNAAGELEKHALVLAEMIRNGAGQIIGLKAHKTKYCRAEEQDQYGNINAWWWSGHWTVNERNIDSLRQRRMERIPVYNGEEAPGKRQTKFVLQLSDDLLCNDGYYPVPTYWGSWEWIELANRIPQFHRANLSNGYNMRWHIEIPSDYFLDYEAYHGAMTEDEKAQVLNTAKQREQAFMDDVNTFLADLENAGRTIFTKYELDKALGKDYPGIKITALSYDMKDEALLKLFERSNTANISAQGIHPTLANIETQGKLSSGTEIRNAYLMWLIINTHQQRGMLMRPIELIKKINGWPADVHYGIRDYELTALSSNASGMQERQNEPVV